MTVVLVGAHPEFDVLLERRRTLGQDTFDEVWEGVYHVAPNAGTEHAQVAAQIVGVLFHRAWERGLHSSSAFNLGSGRDDFRVPDAGWFAESAHGTYAPTAVAVLEVLSPGDETFAKFDFYGSRGVLEILVAHPTERWVRCYAAGTGLLEQPDSSVFGISMTELGGQIRWP